MAVIQHQAILLDHSLAVARPNPNKKERVEHYANIAFPPAAQADILAALNAVANGIPLSNLHLPVQQNAHRKNQKGVSTTVAGIPGDWLIMRVSTSPEYPPACVDADGTVITVPQQINAVFYAGRKIMADVWFKLSAPHQKGQTIFANIGGVIAQADGERLAIGRNPVGDLQRYAVPGAASTSAPGANAQTNATPPQANPFGGAAQPQTHIQDNLGYAGDAGGPAKGDNPFAQAAGAASANPFAPAQ